MLYNLQSVCSNLKVNIQLWCMVLCIHLMFSQWQKIYLFQYKLNATCEFFINMIIQVHYTQDTCIIFTYPWALPFYVLLTMPPPPLYNKQGLTLKIQMVTNLNLHSVRKLLWKFQLIWTSGSCEDFPYVFTCETLIPFCGHYLPLGPWI